ncbi:MAG TPA: type II and III secretion system protein [Bryobacteraceae bacterium]|nr:type II and III secretion system protein [Bryobacteraceae bacterium]
MPVRLISTVLAAAALLCAQQQDSPRDTAMALARKAKEASKAGHDSEAFILSSEAAAILPRKYTSLMKSMQAAADREAARNRTAPAITEPPEHFDSLTAREFAAARQPQEPPVLMVRSGRQDFDLSGNARTLFDQLAQHFSLAAVYDSEYPTDGPSYRFRLTAADYREAIHDLEAVTGSFVTPLTAHLLLVAQDNPTKRNAIEQTVSVSVPIPQATTSQELTEVMQVVRQAFNVEKVAVDNVDNTIVLRDRISRVAPAQDLLNQLFSWRPEVLVDIEFLEVSDSDLINYGFNVTNSFQAVALGNILHNQTAAPAGVANLVTFGNGKTLIGLSVAQVQALFNETLSSATTLFRAQARAVNGQPATFHVGERYPIITQQFAGQTTVTTGTTYAPPPVFQYQDLGVQLKVTPSIHGFGEVTLAVDTSYQLLTGDSVNGIPVIGRRQLTTTVRLRDNEWAVIAGLINPSESKAVGGFWGLAQIPFLGNLFKQTTLQKQDSQILIAIKPHLLSLAPDQVETHPVRVGTETRPWTPL